MSTIRQIRPLIGFRGTKARDLGKLPEVRWVAPTDLYVDEEYQRDLHGRRSKSLITKMVQTFKWRRIKPPVVVELEDGKLHCIDGQHTATAAATVGVPLIPIFIVDAPTQELRADSFVGHNRDRIVMSTLDVYKGMLRANDSDAMDIHNVCTRANIRITQGQTLARPRVGDCAAVSVIGGLIKRHSVLKARKVLEALVLAGRAPISRAEIDAVEAMMLVKHPSLESDQMASVIRAVGTEGLIRSRMAAVAARRPHKHCLYEVYLEVLEKQNAPVAV